MGYKYNVNHEYFKNIDTEYKAYILGFIFADGCVSQPIGNRQLNFRIGIQEEDSYILKELSNKAAGGQINTVKTPSSIKKKYKPQVCVNISSNQLCNDLIKLGCNIRKSSEGMNFPILQPQLVRHFIRGFLDGDGSIILKKLSYKYKRKTQFNLPNSHKDRYKLRVAFCSTSKIFLEEITKQCKIEKFYIASRLRKQIVYILWIENKTEVDKLLFYLYNDSQYFLKRKYNKVLEFNKTIKSEAIDTSIERLETT